jgi:hypothetical protein
LKEKSLSRDGDDAPPHGSVTFCIKDSNFDLSTARTNQSDKSFRPPSRRVLCESFDPTFSKVGGFSGQSPESLTAVSEIPKRRFFFAKLFSLRQWCQRKKRYCLKI